MDKASNKIQQRLISYSLKLAIGLFGVLLIIYLLIWAFSPALLRWQINQQLSQYQFYLSSDTSIRINPFLFEVSVNNLQLKSEKNSLPFPKVEQAAIDLDALALIEKQIRIEKFEISGIQVDSQINQESVNIGNWVIGSSEENLTHIGPTQVNTTSSNVGESKVTETLPANKEVDTWRVSSDELRLRDSVFVLEHKGQMAMLEITDLTVSQLNIGPNKNSLQLALQAKLNQSPVEWTASFEMVENKNGFSNEIVSQFSISDIDLSKLNYLLPRSLTNIGGVSKVNGKIKLSHRSDSEQLKNNSEADSQPSWNVSLENFQLAIDNFVVEADILDDNDQKIAATKSDSHELDKLSNKNVNKESQKNESQNKKSQIKDSLKVDLQKFDLILQGLDVQIQGNVISVSDNNLGLQLKNGGVTLKDSKDTLAKFGQVNVNEGKILLSTAQEVSALIQEINASDLIVSEFAENRQPTLLKLAELNITQAQWLKNHLSLKELKLAELDLQLVRDSQNTIANSVNLKSTQSEIKERKGVSEESSTAVAEQNVKAESLSYALAESNPLSFAIEHIEISENSRVKFVDKKVSPHFQQQLIIERFNIMQLNSQLPEQNVQMNIQLRSDAYTKTALTGTIQPFAKRLNADLQGQVQEYPLPKISPYVKKALGLDMQNGQLDTDIKVNIVNDQIKGDANISVRGLQLAASDNAPTKSEDLKDTTGAMSLNSALKMLADDSGNLQLNVPMSGDISQPDFGIGNFVSLVSKKAIMSAAKSYLMDAFVPYANVLSIIMVAGDLVLQVNIEDLTFSPGQTEIGDAQINFLQELAKLLKDKPKAQIRLCPFAINSELSSTSSQSDGDKTNEMLIALAEKRGQAVKEWLVEEGNIVSSRLLVCQPKIDLKKGSLPRIEFRL